LTHALGERMARVTLEEASSEVASTAGLTPCGERLDLKREHFGLKLAAREAFLVRRGADEHGVVVARGELGTGTIDEDELLSEVRTCGRGGRLGRGSG
jgi:hypothetical protein